MFELSAFTADSVPETKVTTWKQSRLPYSWHHHTHSSFLMIQGDRPLDQFIFDSPRLTLVCHADLLGSGECADYREANSNPAAYLARLYQQKGNYFTRDLHGWFAFILYDHDQRALKAWTDHFGVRRLVYRSEAGSLSVTSDLRLLQAFFADRPQIDPVAILEYLQHTCIPAPRTIYKECSRLQPGHLLVSRPGPAQVQYWDMEYDEDRYPERGLSEWAGRTFEAISTAVETAVRPSAADSLGCFLSGGTDSSSVTGLVGRLTGTRPKSFSIGFDDPRYNEISYARLAARTFDADHHEYFVSPRDVMEVLQHAYSAYDEPFGNSSIIPAYYCARMARESGVRYLLAGDGGDELFGGNQRYANDTLFQKYQQLPLSFKWALDHAPLDKARRYVRRAKIPMPDRIFSYGFLSSVGCEDVFSPALLTSVDGTDSLASARALFHGARATSDLNRWLYLDVKITLTDNDLRKVTPMTELTGVAPRYPLLDPLLADFSGFVPSELKVKGTALRRLFKESMKRFLPDEIIHKKKHGFGLPFSVWLSEHEPLKSLVLDTLGSAACRNRGYFRPDLLEWLWSRYQTESKIYYGDVLWVFLTLELWHLMASSSSVR